MPLIVTWSTNFIRPFAHPGTRLLLYAQPAPLFEVNKLLLDDELIEIIRGSSSELSKSDTLLGGFIFERFH